MLQMQSPGTRSKVHRVLAVLDGALCSCNACTIPTLELTSCCTAPFDTVKYNKQVMSVSRCWT